MVVMLLRKAQALHCKSSWAAKAGETWLSITECLKPVPKEVVGGLEISFSLLSSVPASHFESSPFTI